MTLTNFKPYSFAGISDIHLGHRYTKTRDEIACLRHDFPDNDVTGELDIIFIAGDLFDQKLSLPDPDVIDIQVWSVDFLKMCAKRNIKVRIVEGTPSHDAGQSEWLVRWNTEYQINADIRYFPTLDIEYMEDLGIHILYLKDNYRTKAADTWVEVQKLLVLHGLEQVDHVIMHGAFHYQIPGHRLICSHEAEDWSKIARGVIIVGHHHVHNPWKNIYPPGSHNRLRHGEEGKKGHIRVTMETPTQPVVRFIPNKMAQIYSEVRVTGLDVEGVHAALEKLKYPAGSHLKLICNQGDVAAAILPELQLIYGKWRLTLERAKSKKKLDIVELTVPKAAAGGCLTKENILPEILKLTHRYETDIGVLARAEFLLKQVLEEM